MGKDLRGKELGKGLSQRSDGRYMARFKRKDGSRPCFYSKKLQECRQWIANAQYEDETTDVNDYTKMSLNAWFDYWVENIYKQSVHETTYLLRIREYNVNIRGSLGQKKIKDISPLDCNIWENQFAELNLSDSTLIRRYHLLRDPLEAAVEFNIINDNPYKSRRLKGRESEKRNILDFEQQKLFCEIARTKTHFHHFLFILNTGVRGAELRGLRWEDVDFENKTVQIRRNLNYVKLNGKYRWHIGPVKTKSGLRTIPLTSDALRCLQMMKYQSLTIDTEWKDYVFLSAMTGGPLQGESYKRVLKQICKEGELPDISLHSLRHTFATRCVESRMNVKILCKIMGHSKITTTMDLYAHATEAEKTIEMKHLELYLANCETNEE